MPEQTNNRSAEADPTISSYRILRTLAPHKTYLATDAAGRAVVLKRLDHDCLLKGQLHPNIKDRLARVRELAMTSLATLYGVERDGTAGEAYLVWQFLEGLPLDEHLSATDRMDRQRAIVLREAIMSVESLHARGLVHGAIHARNIFISDAARGSVKLTHVSPLLHHDFGRDEAAVLRLLREMAGRGNGGPLTRLAEDTAQGRPSLRTLVTRLTTLIETGEVGAAPESDRRPRMRLRVGSILAALVLAAAGVGVMLHLKHRLARPAPPPMEPPVLKGPAPAEQRP
jgi:hypothetical protein